MSRHVIKITPPPKMIPKQSKEQTSRIQNSRFSLGVSVLFGTYKAVGV